MAAFDVEVLLPVHNEGASIASTIWEIYNHLKTVAEVGFIVCEDGSNDNSKEVLRSLACDLPMRLELADSRKGYSNAMKEGLQMTQADYLLCMEGDGQCDPKDSLEFWRNRDRADVIIGWRVNRSDTLLRRTCSRFFYLVYQTVFHTPVHDPSFSYVLLKRAVAKEIAKEMGCMREGFWWEFVARAHRRGYKFLEIPVNHRNRTAGLTKVYRFQRLPEIFAHHVIKIWNQTKIRP